MSAEGKGAALTSQNFLSFLYEYIVTPPVDKRFPDTGKVDQPLLQRYNIQLLPFDPEKSSALESSIPFRPLSQSELDRHPIDAAKYSADVWHQFREYPPATDDFGREGEGFWDSEHCARRVKDHLRGWIEGFTRTGFTGPEPPSTLSKRTLCGEAGWERIRIPNPLILHCTFSNTRLGQKNDWSATYLYERTARHRNVPTTPHLTFMSMHNTVGENGSILYGELAALITVMRQRASQPILAEDEDEEARLFEEVDEFAREKTDFPLAFAEERAFPVLMASLFGPQHGRLIYAMTDRDHLMIHQSAIYSFEKEVTAPFDLFARWLLSSPVEGPADA